MRLHLLRRVLLPLLLALAAACSLPKDTGIKIGVPYRMQESYNYCGATGVLMWRLFHGLPEVSQQTIFQWMFNSYPACSNNQLGIVAAVRHFTLSRDAYWDYGNPTSYRALVSRQIASMDARVPAIVAVRYDHAGVLNGGKWHQEGSFNVWDFVYFHDPAFRANDRYEATDWLEFFCPGYAFSCDQIVSSSAVAAWQFNLQTYGGSVVPAGGGFNPDGSWPPAY